MNLNDQFHLYFIFDLTPFRLKPRNRRSPVRGGNERDPDVELQRYLAIATTNIGTPCGKGLAVTDSASLITSALLFSANSRSPPLGNSYYSLHSWNAVFQQEAA